MSVVSSLWLCLLVWCALSRGVLHKKPLPESPSAQLLSIARASPPPLGGEEDFGGYQWKSLAQDQQRGRYKRFVYEGFGRQCSRNNASGDGLPHPAVGWLANGCTAFLVGPRQLLTAGGCVYGRRGWQTEGLDFYRQMECWSRGELMQWERAYVLRDWARYGLQGANLGLIVLKEGYNSSDYLGFGYTETWSNTSVTSVGYTDDQFGRYYCQCKTTCTAAECMAYDSNSALVYVVFGWRGAHRLCHRCATTSTTCGSPVLASDTGQFNRTEEGQGGNPNIYVGGVITGDAFSSNTAVKITKSRFDAIRYVKCMSGVATSCEGAGQ